MPALTISQVGLTSCFLNDQDYCPFLFLDVNEARSGRLSPVHLFTDSQPFACSIESHSYQSGWPGIILLNDRDYYRFLFGD